MAKYFINHPVFAWVIAIMIMLAGLLAITQLPIEQYPDIAPPTITVSTNYIGADATTVENTVTQIIEQNLTGLDNLQYMQSTSSASGNVSIALTFEVGTDPDIAQVQVLNKVEQAKASLPSSVQQNGIAVTKSGSSFLKVIGFYSENNSLTQDAIADYLSSNIKDPISRVSGVGSVQVFGTEHAMRIWLNPYQMTDYKITVTELVNALKAQNAQITAGQLGGTPSVPHQGLNASITVQSRFTTPQQFENILIRVNPDGSQVRLKDVAKVELGASSYAMLSNYNGRVSAGLGISLASGANQLTTSSAVDAELKELSRFFPPSLKAEEPFDTTPFVKISIDNVARTLIEAILLVILVMYIFLQNPRATLIPTITVPVVLLGTFAVLAVFGYSINTLTMFAMVLAIGLLVDDSIVVVENVERIITDEKLSAKEATIKSMEQITGALVGIALVLSAVFIPMAFFGGATGGIYRQFSITIISAMLLSVLVALILTPALCATFLKESHHEGRKLKFKPLAVFFNGFNNNFAKLVNSYVRHVGQILKRPFMGFSVYAIIIAVAIFGMTQLPSGYIPDEDQGSIIGLVQLPPGSTQEQTEEVMRKITEYAVQTEQDIEEIFSVNGYSFSGIGQNIGVVFLKLRDWSERTKPENKINSILGRINQHFGKTEKGALAYFFNIPAIPSLGIANGFSFVLQDAKALGHQALMQARNQIMFAAMQDPRLQQVRPDGMEDSPQFNITIDHEMAASMGISIADINNTLSTVFGSAYVDDFINNGRVKRVYVQGEAPYRMNDKDISYWYVKNGEGKMVPISALASTSWQTSSPSLQRYNGLPSTTISGSAANGVSSGEAMLIMEDLAKKLPDGFAYEWTGASYQEQQSGEQAPILYTISALVVFLCLAALYESWSIPLSVMLVVPLGVLGVVAAIWMRGLEDDVYFKVAILTTIGLSAKNAILIVEFAKDTMDKQGKGLIEAILEACRLRLRPILMTSIAFILGVTPLAISSGAGAASQNAVGTGVVGGMLSATFLAIYLVPLFFMAIQRLFTRGKA